jgi:hypothetical protein
MSFPLIYCNGDSYSDENIHAPIMQGNTYAHVVGQLLNGYVINHARAGSCNRRILRSATHDLLQQRELNPDQKIIALINLSFEIRDEIWLDDVEKNRESTESNFRPHQFSEMPNWRERLLNNQNIVKDHSFHNNQKYLKKWSEGRAYFYSPYAERINLAMDLLLFESLLEQHNIQYLIFQGPRAESLDNEYLLNFFLSRLPDTKIFNLEKFNFCAWCNNNQYDTIDPTEPREIGHYGPAAHRAFAEQVIIPTLKETNQI